ncbi:MAG: DUF4234 domain-containing protein [Clostridia bacterium]|nr:DUF4234 domain-containing protein [Clostridia bacterium]
MRTVKEDRSLLILIVLSVVTLGIYALWHQYTVIRDVNDMLHGDGKNTAGLVCLIVFSLLTCGIYTCIWYYQLGERLAVNLQMRRVPYSIGGGFLLILTLFSRFCPLLALVAEYKVIHAVNHLAHYHNHSRRAAYEPE